MDLAGFIDTYREAIAKRVVESYPPLYRPSEACARPRSGNGHTLPKPLRSPLEAQTDAIRGAALPERSDTAYTGLQASLTRTPAPQRARSY